MDNLQQPLINDERDEDDAVYEISRLRRKAPDGAGPGTFVTLLTFAAGISGLLFGCERRLPC